ncbi:MAG: hypothetical protein SGPRY_001670 [Prymnesium sp.]
MVSSLPERDVFLTSAEASSARAERVERSTVKQLVMDKRARTSAFTCFYLVACHNLSQYTKLLQEKGVNILVRLGC